MPPLPGCAGAVHRFDVGTDAGCAGASDFLVRHLALPPEEAPFLVEGGSIRFTDVSVGSVQMMQAVSLINIASAEALGEMAGVQVDPARFRANILIDGWPTRRELDLIGQGLRVGTLGFTVLKRTRNCAATRANPETGMRDPDTLALLGTHLGHLDFGIYPGVNTEGSVSTGNAVTTGTGPASRPWPAPRRRFPHQRSGQPCITRRHR